MKLSFSELLLETPWILWRTKGLPTRLRQIILLKAKPNTLQVYYELYLVRNHNVVNSLVIRFRAIFLLI